MDAVSKAILKKVIIDIVCLACLGIPIFGLYFFGSPYKRGLFCDDESIRYPFKKSTISSAMLYSIGFGLPISFILITEWIHYRQGERQLIYGNFLGFPVNMWMHRCYSVIGVFVFGAAITTLLSDIAKCSIGRLRPHFWDVCDPAIDCTLPSNKWRYIENFTCLKQTVDAKHIRDARKSFLSGHSSFSAYCMIFLALYIQSRVQWRGSHLLRHIMQFFCVSLAWATALSRVSDYKHHWSDVLAGLLLGTIVAVFTVRFISDLRLNGYNKAPTSEILPNKGLNFTGHQAKNNNWQRVAQQDDCGSETCI